MQYLFRYADQYISLNLVRVFQNEPQNNNPTYPTCAMLPAVEALIGAALRTLLDSNGLSTVRVIGYEVCTPVL
jgi:hypothetical protein